MLLMAHVHKSGQPTEAEPVEVMATNKAVWLVLDDGTELVFDADEFRRATDLATLEAEAA